jgi:pyrroline-5-carboxylate reductase
MLVNEPDDAAFAQLAGSCAGVRRASFDQAATADVVLLALHPPFMAPILSALKPHLGAQTIVVSLAPKISLSALTAGLGTTRVIRMIPNAPSIIGRGYNPVAFAVGVDDAARERVSPLFTPWGPWPVVDEKDLEAYAILTGMGPTYFWFQWQALRDFATQAGMPADRADAALRAMLEGSAATLLESGLPPDKVMDLIPVRPLASLEPSVLAAYRELLPALHAKIRPAVG